MNQVWLAGAMAATLLLAGCAMDPAQTSGRVEVESENVQVAVAFNERDRQRILAYYQSHQQHSATTGRKGLPPGLAKREQLPPGLQKQVQKNGKLPPGLTARSLPPELERELSPVPRGYVRLQVGTDVVLMNGTTRVVVDVIKDLPL